MKEEIRKVWLVVDYITTSELIDDFGSREVLEMSQEMISHIVNTGGLRPIADYITNYSSFGRKASEEIAELIGV